MLPLSGVRVVDLTRALSGPLATTLLADLGADVVKVEPTPSGDAIRMWGPYHEDVSVYHLSVNRNKRSVALDLRSDEGQRLLHRLLDGADVLAENFRPGVLDALGLGEEQRAATYPDTIVARISGFGPTGPRRDDAGYDQIAQGMAGLMSVTGSRCAGPMRVGIPIADILSGMFAAMGVVASLYGRANGAPSTPVETSLLESTLAVMTFQAQRFLSLGDVPAPHGNDHPILVPYGAYATADHPLNIAVGTDRQWYALASVLGLGDLAHDASFATGDARRENRDRLRELLEDRLATAGQDHWLAQMRSAGVPCGPIHGLDAVFSDDQVKALGMAVETSHPTLGEVPLVRGPLWLQGEPQQIRRPPPLHGQHTGEVLRELGFAATEVEDLADRGVVALAEPGARAGNGGTVHK